MSPPMAYPTPHMETCRMCGSSFEHGPHVYQGRQLKRYKLLVCEACHKSNADGWNREMEPKLLAHLRAANLPVPERNAKGLFPRGD
jgi:hypothetical protein